MNDQEQALLDQLRDVVTPQVPGWWPLAIGWWVLLAVLLCCLVGLAYLLYAHIKKRKREQWRRTALQTHKNIRTQLLDTAAYPSGISELSVLMRRVALVLLPRNQIAASTDDNWLATLDSIGGTQQYTQGVGQLLSRVPYQPVRHIEQQDLRQLLDLTEATIKKAKPVRGITKAGSDLAAV